MDKSLSVYFFNEPVGTLTQIAGELNFTYDNNWLSHSQRQPLSCSLPLQANAFTDAQSRPFFAGQCCHRTLLPVTGRSDEATHAACIKRISVRHWASLPTLHTSMKVDRTPRTAAN